MFQNARAFNQDLSSWNVSIVRCMEHLIVGANNLSQDVQSWGWGMSLFEIGRIGLKVYHFFDPGQSCNVNVSWSMLGKGISAWDVAHVSKRIIHHTATFLHDESFMGKGTWPRAKRGGLVRRIITNSVSSNYALNFQYDSLLNDSLEIHISTTSVQQGVPWSYLWKRATHHRGIMVLQYYFHETSSKKNEWNYSRS